ncbi:hypothetical protein JHK87_055978 [Glycine soja]|nr:hypothetical protein JHK87_055978 [Glycine soja]
MRIEERPMDQVTKFVSEDDIEDDFMAYDIHSGDKKKPAKSTEDHVKPKKKEGPKVLTIGLLEEYTSLLVNYKDVRLKLNDVEKKNRDSIFELILQLGHSNGIDLHKLVSSKLKNVYID